MFHADELVDILEFDACQLVQHKRVGVLVPVHENMGCTFDVKPRKCCIA